MKEKLKFIALVLLAFTISGLLSFIYSEFTFKGAFPKDHLYSLNYRLFVKDKKADISVTIPEGFETIRNCPFFLKLKYVNIDNSEYDLFFNGNKLTPFNTPFKDPIKGIMETDRFAIPKEIVMDKDNYIKIIFKNKTITEDIDFRFRNYYGAVGSDILIYQKIDDYQLNLRAIISFSGIKFSLFVTILLFLCSYLTAIFLPFGLKKAFIINIFSALSGAIFISSLLILNAVCLPYEVFIYSNYLTVLLTLSYISTFIIILSFLFLKGKFDYGTEREIDRVVKAMLLVKDKTSLELKKEQEEIAELLSLKDIIRSLPALIARRVTNALLALRGKTSLELKKEQEEIAEMLSLKDIIRSLPALIARRVTNALLALRGKTSLELKKEQEEISEILSLKDIIRSFNVLVMEKIVKALLLLKGIAYSEINKEQKEIVETLQFLKEKTDREKRQIIKLVSFIKSLRACQIAFIIFIFICLIPSFLLVILHLDILAEWIMVGAYFILFIGLTIEFIGFIKDSKITTRQR